MTHTLWLAVLGFVLATNAFHRRPALPLTDRPRQSALAHVAAGAVLAMGVLSLIAAVGPAALRALDISVPNGRVAAGLVVIASALVQLFRAPEWDRVYDGGHSDSAAAPKGALAALTPIFFPVLLRPELAVLALVGGADVGWGQMTAAIIIGLAAVVGWVMLARIGHWTTRFERSFDRIVCIGLLLLGIDQIIDGILAV